MGRRFGIALVGAGIVAGIAIPALPATAAGTGSISGVAFEDANRNGVRDTGEPVRAGDVVYLYDSTGDSTAAAQTDSAGSYAFTGLAAGSWRVAYAADSWWAIRQDFVPTTTGSLRPDVTVAVASGGTTVDFGWRRIVRSTTAGAPVSSYVGADGMRVESYNDVVPAKELYDAVHAGTVGAEAPYVVVRFGLSSSSTTTTSLGMTGGRYTSYGATVYVAYLTWLENGDRVLGHEYGHAWSLYYAHLVQQDSAMTAYLRARGLEGDSRVGTSYMWATEELIAEDYRQLLGSPNASRAGQANYEIPLAPAVPGLRSFLSTTFTQPPAASPSPPPSPSPSPTPTASPAPSPTPSPSTSPAPSPSPSPIVTRGGGKAGGGTTCKKC